MGFTVDSAIYGFAAGTGFALAENMFYLFNLGTGADLLTWILRGFGTALMHGGNTALLAIIIMSGIQRDKAMGVVIWPALLVAYILHSAYNHFFFHPFLQAILLLIVLPAAFALVFIKNNRLMQNWLEIEFSNEVDMLRMIRQGRFRQTRAGSYLASLRKHFSSETIVDLYCYVSLYLELSIKAKRNLMLKENGFQILIEEDVKGKLLEIEHLRKRIGKTGELALQPLVRMKHRELWKLNQLKK
ncbi:MAG: PrsW family glutamic-type intramembrane protease [Bacteroidota bacterium]|nr:PrsW family glutamic-type intramembrane protease [Bacteroidota bacterium]